MAGSDQAGTPEPTGNGAPTRRAIMGAAGTLAGAIVLTGGPAAARTSGPEHPPAPPAPSAGPDLRREAYRVRVDAAARQASVPLAPHPTNGDEARYPTRIGSDTRGLPHDARGEVDPAAWRAAERAYASGRFEDFEQIPLGGTRKFVNPVGTLAPSLEGTNVTQVPVPPAPALASAERAAEAAENYWQSLLRDVPFADYDDHPDVRAAAAELDRLPGYRGPRVEGTVTPAVLFRGTVTYPEPRGRGGRGRHVTAPGVLVGPWIPQFALRTTPYGTQSIPATHRLPVPGQSFLTDEAEWLAVQNGVAPTRTTAFESTPRHLRTALDVAEWAHNASPLFWGAVLQLAAPAGGTATSPAGIGAPLSPTNPYLKARTQTGSNGTFALGHLQALLNVGVSRAIRATYWQKFFVHRSVRPEAFGGLVHHRVENGADYPIHRDLLDSAVLPRVRATYGSYRLAHAYPEGAPLHGSFPAGSAAIAGVSATLVKAFFDERHVIPNTVQPDPANPGAIVAYDGPPLTVGGELNKLASAYTFGRVFSGIHWRSDSAAGLALGEHVALSILQDERLTIREPFEGFRLTRFDGTTITI